MKKIFLAVVSLLTMMSHSLSASSTSNVRLEYIQAPNARIAGGRTTVLQVLSNGDVIQNIRQALPIPIPTQLVKHLDAYEMDKIERLIERARSGRIVQTPLEDACKDLSNYTEKLTADNGKVFLKLGSICQAYSYNASRAAKKLVQILERFVIDANGKVN